MVEHGGAHDSDIGGGDERVESVSSEGGVTLCVWGGGSQWMSLARGCGAVRRRDGERGRVVHSRRTCSRVAFERQFETVFFYSTY